MIRLSEAPTRSLLVLVAAATLGCDRTPTPAASAFTLPTNGFAASLGLTASLALTADGNTLAEAGNDSFTPLANNPDQSGTIEIWDLRKGALRQSIRSPLGRIHALALTRDGRTLFAACDQGLTRWDLRRDAFALTIEQPILLDRLVLAPGEATLITAGQDGTIRVHDVHSLKVLRVIAEGPARARALAVDAQGKRIAVARGDLNTLLFDLMSGRLTATLVGHGHSFEWIKALSFSPDGRRLVTGSSGGLIEIWDPEQIKPLRSFAGHTDWERVDMSIIDLAFSPDGKVLASSGLDGTVRLWDFETGGARALFSDYPRRAMASNMDMRTSPCCLLFSPQGDMLLSAHDDHKVRAWRVPKAPRN